MVLARRRAGHRDPVLPRASAPRATRATHDARGRGRQPPVADAHPAPRGGPRGRHGLSAAAPRRWREVFGPASLPYPERYRARPGSRRYVHHLGGWYAQAHPTEDFAETFAVWLTPRSGWRRQYAGWPALQQDRDRRRADGGDACAAAAGALAGARSSPRRPTRCTLAEHYRRSLARACAIAAASPTRLLLRVFTDRHPARHTTAARQRDAARRPSRGS